MKLTAVVMSGGVDSNAATYLINEAGYRSDIVYR